MMFRVCFRALTRYPLGRQGLFHFLCRVVAFIGLSAPCVLQAADVSAFGGVKGDFSVTSSGVAQYSLPLSLPSSRGSFVPPLAIEYSSRSEDGELGVGFHLVGESAIGRCAQTVAQDGKVGRISYDEAGDTGTTNGITDRFCLDGQRLILVSGQYGYDGSEYRTEIDSQQRIMFFRPATPANPYFTVEAADGRKLIYGDIDNAVKWTATLSTPHISKWMLHRVTDRNGNYYEFQYLGASVPGSEQLVGKISYGANALAPKTFDYEVGFTYDTSRPDTTTKYVASAQYKVDRRLAEIDVTRLTTAGNVLVAKYELSYLQGTASARSRIKSITRCNKQRLTTDFDCLAPVQFSWTDKSATTPAWALDNLHNLPADVSLFISQTVSGTTTITPTYVRFVDLDGDGVNDIIWSALTYSTSATVARGAYLNTPNGWVSHPEYFLPTADPTNSSIPATSIQYGSSPVRTDVNSQFVDLNGDGLVDFIYWYVVPSADGTQTIGHRGAYIQVKNTSGTTSSRWQFEPKYAPPAAPTPTYFHALNAGNLSPRFVDVNGDGLPDLLYQATGLPSNYSGYDANGNYVGANGNYVFINTPTATGATYWQSNSSYLLPYPLYRNTQTTIDDTHFGWPGDTGAQFVDLNGDGLLDYVYYRAYNGTVQKGAYINNQYGAAVGATNWTCNGIPLTATDYTKKWVCNDAYMPPTPMFTDQPYSFISPALGLTGNLGVRFVDLNNDGLQDLIYSREAKYDNSGYPIPTTTIQGAYLNTGSGWVSAPGYNLPDAPPGGTFTGKRLLSSDALGELGGYFVDVNGDNLVDYVFNWQDTDQNGNIVRLDQGAYINTGTGWRADDRYTPLCPLFSFFYKYAGARVDDINGDGIADTLCDRPDLSTAGIKTYTNTPRVDLLQQVTDGYGATTTLTFKTISDPTIYTQATSTAYPDSEVASSATVVSKVERSAGTAGGETIISNYSYAGLKTNLQGRGMIGFAQVTEDTAYPPVASSIITDTRYETTQTNYSQSFPYYGFIVSQSNSVRSGSGAPVITRQRVSTPSSDFAYKTPSAGVYVPYVKNYLETSFDPESGQTLSTRLVSEDIDNFANVLDHKETVTQASNNVPFVVDEAKTFLAPDLTSWQIARLNTDTRTFHRVPVTGVTPDIVRKHQFTYQSNGLLATDVREPDIALLRQTTSYTYDVYGNLLTRTLSGSGDVSVPRSGIVDRVESLTYAAGVGYSEGIYPDTHANALNQATTYTYDGVTGKVMSEIDPNAISTIYDRDSFGLELTKKRDAAGTDRIMRTTTRSFCVAECQPGEVIHEVVTVAGAAPADVFYDSVGREVRRVGKAFNASPSAAGPLVTASVYDTRGKVVCVSRPMYGSVPLACGSTAGTNKWTQYAYDKAGRETLKREPTGDLSTAYSGLTTQATNARGQTHTELHNAVGDVESITDAAGKTTTFLRDAAGAPLTISDALGNQTTFIYDSLGRKKSMTDPDMGQWQYDYDVADQLIRQLDALGKEARFYFDPLGRMVRREETDMTSTWAFDTQPNGIGLLAQASTDTGYTRTPEYDVWSRAVKTTTQVGTTNYVMQAGYDTADRVVSVTYPTLFQYQNEYDANGYLVRVKDNTAALATHPVFWQADARDEDGHVTHETLGNGLVTARSYYPDSGRINTIQTGAESNAVIQASAQNESYSFDALGNLGSRSQALSTSNFTELFQYDALNRIQTAYISGGMPKVISYDDIGNISFRSDVGLYSSTGCGGSHRVCSITGLGTFGYDLNGNLTAGNGRGYSWTAANMPGTVTVSTTNSEAFTYGDDHQRVRRTSMSNGQTTTITYLNPRIDLGGTYEKAEKPDGTVEHTQYVYAGSYVVGAVVQTDAAPTTPSTRYLHQDHVGSVVSVSDSSGQILEQFSYDMWGKRRALDGQDAPQSTNVAGLTDMALPAAGTDRYNLVQRTAGSNYLVFHTNNWRKTSPVSVGPASPVGQTMRVKAEVLTSASNKKQRDFMLGIENTATRGAAGYQRFAVHLNRDVWTYQVCTAATCQEGSFGSGAAKDNTVYVVEVGSTALSVYARLYEKGAQQATESQYAVAFDVSGGNSALQKRAVAGVNLPASYVPDVLTAIPVRHRDAPSTIQVLTWDQLIPQNGAFAATTTRHGFTLHEELDAISLVHMNGRVYDPLVGRFVSADPNVFHPDNTQDYNRYSYVWNNPLSFTDPSGFEGLGDWAGSMNISEFNWSATETGRGAPPAVYGTETALEVGRKLDAAAWADKYAKAWQFARTWPRNNSGGDFGIWQLIAPSVTSELAAHPIGGSASSQSEFGTYVNQMRTMAVAGESLAAPAVEDTVFAAATASRATVYYSRFSRGSTDAGEIVDRVAWGEKGAERSVPGFDKPFRAANPMFPPNAAVMKKMAGMRICTGTDCSEIASSLMNAAGSGRILRVTGSAGQDLRLLEYGKIDSGFKYHEVFTDGRYVYDPRLSSDAVPLGDWTRMVQSLNPGAVIK